MASGCSTRSRIVASSSDSLASTFGIFEGKGDVSTTSIEQVEGKTSDDEVESEGESLASEDVLTSAVTLLELSESSAQRLEYVLSALTGALAVCSCGKTLKQLNSTTRTSTSTCQGVLSTLDLTAGGGRGGVDVDHEWHWAREGRGEGAGEAGSSKSESLFSVPAHESMLSEAVRGMEGGEEALREWSESHAEHERVVRLLESKIEQLGDHLVVGNTHTHGDSGVWTGRGSQIGCGPITCVLRAGGSRGCEVIGGWGKT